jgi:hypothetical protein
MLLDGVLTTPDLAWFTTAAEKTTYLTQLTASAGGNPPAEAAAEAAPRIAAELPRPFPIGVASDGRAVLLYLATEPWKDGFRSFLQAHTALLRATPTWTLRLVFPRPLDRVYDAYQGVIREELESRLHPVTITELKWYFEHREKATREPLHPQTQGFLTVGAKVFGTPRFTAMYRRWLRHGNVVFEGPSSSAIAEALSSGRGRIECVVLPHTYRHLSPLVDEPRSTSQKVEEGVEKGAVRGDDASAHPQPPPSTPWSTPVRSVLM